MSAEGEFDENVDDGGMAAPGAPTPLSVLEVAIRSFATVCDCLANPTLGHQWTYEARHPADRGRRLQHCRVGSIHTEADAGTNQGYFRSQGQQDPGRR
jgi:hypothetical protein